MQINNDIKKNILSLDDKTLKNVIGSIAQKAGVESSGIRISDNDLVKIRNIIQNATDKDANEALNIIGEEKAKKILDELNRQGGNQ